MFSVGGMAEAQALGVQRDSGEHELVGGGRLEARIEIDGAQALGASVVGVHRQRVAEDGQMRAHLMQTAGPRAQLDRRECRRDAATSSGVGTTLSNSTTATRSTAALPSSEPLERPPRGHARLPGGLARSRWTHLAAANRDQRAVDLARPDQRTAAQSPVALVDLVALEGHRHRSVRLGRDGEQQNAGCPAIQAVHDEDVAAQRLGHVLTQRTLTGGGAAPRNDDAPRGFGDGDQCIIVV